MWKKKNPIYKNLIKLKENVQNRKKVFSFKKLKWKNFIENARKKIKFFNRFKYQDHEKHIVTKYPNKNVSYKKHFKIRLVSRKKLKTFYGNLKNRAVNNTISLLKQNKLKKNYFLLFLKTFEKRLDVVLYRSKFCFSIKNAQQLILQKSIKINNKIVTNKSMTLQSGDLISINRKKSKLLIKKNIIKLSHTWPLPPKHLLINYRILQIIFFEIKTSNFSNVLNFSFNLGKVVNKF